MNVREITEVVLSLNGERRIDPTVDQIYEGGWDQPVTGVVTTFMATVDVVRETIRSGANFIITHEPTYFNGRDRRDWLLKDEVYHRKQALINDHHLAVWRYHDHAHMGNGDIIYNGLLDQLGWQKHLVTGRPDPHVYAIPPMSVEQLVAFFKEKLGMAVVRVVGRTDITCSRVGILVGGGSLGLGDEAMPARLMNDENIDCMVCGEITEWTLSAYVRDAAALGFDKTMLIVGHERSEGPGMKGLAETLKPLLPGLPVAFLDAGEPFTYC